MREAIVSAFLSLDHVIQELRWTFPFWNDEIAAFKHDEPFAAGVFLPSGRPGMSKME